MVHSALGNSRYKFPEAGQSIVHTFKKQREVTLAEGLRRGREDAM